MSPMLLALRVIGLRVGFFETVVDVHLVLVGAHVVGVGVGGAE